MKRLKWGVVGAVVMAVFLLSLSSPQAARQLWWPGQSAHAQAGHFALAYTCSFLESAPGENEWTVHPGSSWPVAFVLSREVPDAMRPDPAKRQQVCVARLEWVY
jgi:hypothetical protein